MGGFAAMMFSMALIAFVVVALPVWIVAHYLVRWRAARVISGEDEALLAELHRTAERLEGRVQTLERILDAELPNWRRDHD